MSRRGPPFVVPFNQAFVAHIVSLIRNRQGQSGTLLPLLIAYLFRTIRGLAVSQRLMVKGGEIDIVVSNFGNLGQPLRWFGDYFLVECKDQISRVDEKELSHFLTKMNFTKTTAGAVVSIKGLTGSPRYDWASRDRRLAFSQMDVIILDVTLDDLARLGSADDFIAMLQEKYEDLRFR